MKQLDKYFSNSVLRGTLVEECKRLALLEKRLVEDIMQLPVGNIRIKMIKGRPYLYLRSWEDKKTRERYIGSLDKEKAQEVISAVKQRLYLEERLIRVRLDRETAKRAIQYEPKVIRIMHIKRSNVKKEEDLDESDTGRLILEDH
ncbi:hypothetical protein [Anaeromusa acidaminophila]|uniref:hypothetical protein n=1 Tax=Anaeromusa acidaminophila TaxID=81464 RepID=UPI0003631A69|nr:hypothetical protein [Anaeromusa acidaminophila]